MRVVKRVVAVCALLLGGVAGWASAAEALPCAEYVSTGMKDAPGIGHLVGTETVKYTIAAQPGGIGATTETTFEVGFYEFDGKVLVIDCRNYTLFR